MATSAGRFAVGSQFALVQRFFAPFLTSPTVPPGRYTKAQLGVIAGLDTFSWKMQQYTNICPEISWALSCRHSISIGFISEQ